MKISIFTKWYVISARSYLSSLAIEITPGITMKGRHTPAAYVENDVLTPVGDVKKIFENLNDVIAQQKSIMVDRGVACSHHGDLWALIPSFNDHAVLEKCINSLQKNSNEVVSRIVITDDNSNDVDHKSYLDRLSREKNDIPITVLRSEENRGFAGNVNKGLSIIPEDVDVLLLNSDTEVLVGSVHAMFALARENIAIVGSKLLYPDGTIQHGGIFRNFNSLEWFEHLYRGFSASHPPASISKTILSCTGAALLIPNEVRKSVGYLDEKYPMAFEDVDYCLRAALNGFRTMYCGLSEIVHHESVTRGKIQGARELRSQEYFWEKWRDFFDNRNVYEGPQIKVIFVLKDTGVGGGHRVIFNHAEYLSQNGFNVSIWALSDKPDWYEISDRINFRKFTSFEYLTNDLKCEQAIKIATWWETSDVVAEASIVSGIPAYFIQDFEISYYMGRDVYNAARAYSSYRPEFVNIVTCRWMQDVLNKMCFHSHYVGLGIDTDIFHYKGGDRREKSILVCARGEPIKGFSLSRKILEELLNRGYKVTVFGVDSDLVGNLRGCEFVYRPSNDTLSSLYSTHEFFLQTSIHEGLSLPPLEAMSCGCIPIVTLATGNEEYIVDCVNSFVIPRDLRKAVEVIESLDYSMEIMRMRDEMRETVARYSWSRSYSKFSSILQAIASRGSYGCTDYNVSESGAH